MTEGLLRVLDGSMVEERLRKQKKIVSQDGQGDALRANLIRRKSQKLRRQSILVSEI